MRFANHDGRLTMLESGLTGDLHGARGTDVHDASGGQIPAEPDLALRQWDEILQWAGAHAATPRVTIDRARLASPSPKPSQIFGIGINYADHGAEAGMEAPEVPLVFTKLGTAVTGPFDPIELSLRDR